MCSSGSARMSTATRWKRIASFFSATSMRPVALRSTLGRLLLRGLRSASMDIRAPVNAQRDIPSQQRGAAPGLPVRLGVDMGEASQAQQGYGGTAAPRAGRVCEVGQGGQTVVSSAAHGILAAEPPAGVRLRDLCEIRLPSFAEPEPLF